MTLISSEIPSFTGGVSQQAPTQRLSSQMEEQVNGFSTVAQGLLKRPPTEHIARVLNTRVTNAFLHAINRDNTERYLVFIYNGDLKVFDLAGNEISVSFPDGKSYLNVASPRNAFSAITVADYTFIVNKAKKVLAGSSKTEARNPEALVYVKLGNYGKTYKININGTDVASYTTPDGSSPSHANNIDTSYIATQLYNQLVAYRSTSVTVLGNSNNTYTLPSGWDFNDVQPEVSLEVNVTVEHTAASGREYTTHEWRKRGTSGITFPTPTTYRLDTPPTGNFNSFRFTITKSGGTTNTYGATISGSTIHLTMARDFNIKCEDGYAGNAMIPIKGKVQKVGDLPPHCGVDGFKCMVVGEAGSTDDDYWVEYSGNASSGVWEESVAPDVTLGVDPATMPHQLVRQANGTFVFQKANWRERTVGDEDSNPLPTFINRTLTNMFFYRNRLGFLVDDAIVMSENGSFFNFFRTSVKTLLDNDPIDLSVSHTKVALLHWAIPYNKELVLFSEQTQFVLQDADLLTAKTAAIKQTTDFPCSIIASPVSTGKNIYFCVDKGNFSAVREYYSDVNTGEDATDITAHIPTYIPSNIYKIANSPTEDIFVCLSDDKPNCLFPYCYYWNGQQKLQSSWSRWELEETDTILYVEFINSILYLAIARSDGVYLESMDLSLAPKNNDELYKTCVDRRVKVAVATADEEERYATFNAPYPYDRGQYSVIVCAGQTGAGKYIKARWENNHFIIDEYLPVGTQVLLGRDYSFSVQLSTLYPQRQNQSGGSISYTEGRLALTRLTVNYDKTGFFKVHVTPEGRTTKTKTFSGKNVGRTSVLADLRVSTGTFRVPIMTKNENTAIVIENDSPLPCSITSAIWEGDYTNRSQRL